MGVTESQERALVDRHGIAAPGSVHGHRALPRVSHSDTHPLPG